MVAENTIIENISITLGYKNKGFISAVILLSTPISTLESLLLIPFPETKSKRLKYT